MKLLYSGLIGNAWEKGQSSTIINKLSTCCTCIVVQCFYACTLYVHVEAGAYEPPKAVKERTSVSYRKVNRAAAVVIDSVVVIPRTQSALVVSTIFGSFLVALAVRLLFNVTTRIT